jgi:hypothetical protein
VVKLALAPLGRVSGDRATFAKGIMLLARRLYSDEAARTAFNLIAVAGSKILVTDDLFKFIQGGTRHGHGYFF